MIDDHASKSCRNWGLPTSCGLLSLALLCAFGVIGAVAYRQHAADGLVAAAVAAGVCWLGACLALTVTFLARGPHAPLIYLGLGTLFRMGLPLVFGIVVSRRGGPLAEAGVFGLIVAFFLVALVVETLLSLQVVNRTDKISRAL